MQPVVNCNFHKYVFVSALCAISVDSCMFHRLLISIFQFSTHALQTFIEKSSPPVRNTQSATKNTDCLPADLRTIFWEKCGRCCNQKNHDCPSELALWRFTGPGTRMTLPYPTTNLNASSSSQRAYKTAILWRPALRSVSSCFHCAPCFS